jgi:NUMOD3 motif
MTRKQLKEKYSNSHYVYLHIDPIVSQVVYIGKGRGDRAWQLYNRREDHKKWALNLRERGLEPKIDIARVLNTEEEAYELEKILISLFRKSGIKLFNILPGGRRRPSGAENPLSGKPRSKEHCQKLSKALLGKPRPDLSEPTRQRMIGNTIKKGTKSSEETKVKISKSLKGNQRRSLKVLCINNGKIYNSIKEAWTQLNLDERSVFRVLKGEYNHTKGYRFKYLT